MKGNGGRSSVGAGGGGWVGTGAWAGMLDGRVISGIQAVMEYWERQRAEKCVA